MAHDEDDAGTAPAPAGAKGKGHPGHGLLSGPHRDEILIVSTVVLVGLSYLTLRRMSGATSSAAPGTAPGLVSSTNPTGAVAGYDQATMQGFAQLLQNQGNQLDQLEATLTNPGGGVTPSTPPAPHALASALFGPSSSQRFVRFANGQIDQIQSDGSLLWLNASESAKVFGPAGWARSGKVDQLTVAPPSAGVYTTGGNISAAAKRSAGATPVSAQ